MTAIDNVDVTVVNDSPVDMTTTAIVVAIPIIVVVVCLGVLIAAVFAHRRRLERRQVVEQHERDRNEILYERWQFAPNSEYTDIPSIADNDYGELANNKQTIYTTNKQCERNQSPM